jgi:hypothetical protein
LHVRLPSEVLRLLAQAGLPFGDPFFFPGETIVSDGQREMMVEVHFRLLAKPRQRLSKLGA